MNFLNKLVAFLDTLHKKELQFAEITTEFVSDFYSYLGTLSNTRSNVASKLSKNYKETIMNKFRALISLGITQN